MLAKFGNHRSYRNRDINSYMDTLGKAELTASIRLLRYFKIRNTDLQSCSSGYGWQKNEKKENTGNCKALCVSRKRK